MRKSTKGELLEKYTSRDVHTFIQYDGFINAEADCNTQPDEDKDAIFGGFATEDLMNGSNVRVLLNPATPADAVLRVLRKIVAMIEQQREARNKSLQAEYERDRVAREKAFMEHNWTAGEVAGMNLQLYDCETPF